MPSIQVKNVPDEVHEVFRKRATLAGKSLQEYMLDRLVQDAKRPTSEEILDQISRQTGGKMSLAFAVESVRQDRDSR